MKRKHFIASLLALVATPLMAFKTKEPSAWMKRYAKGTRLPWTIREFVAIEGIDGSISASQKLIAVEEAKQRIFNAIDPFIHVTERKDDKGRTIIDIRVDLLADEEHSEILRKAFGDQIPE